MKNYLVELIGTFFLVLTIGLCVIKPGAESFAPLAIGLGLAVMVYAGGPISGAHYNPAVTLAVFLRGKCPSKDVLPYMIAQVLGAALAAQTVLFMKAGSSITLREPVVTPILLAESLFTFALCYVVLNVATSARSAGNSYFGLAIGGTVTCGAYSVGSISGAAFNPAVVVGATLMGLIPASGIWIYLVANFLGAGAAALVYRAVNEE